MLKWIGRILSVVLASALVFVAAWEFWPRGGSNPDRFILTADRILTMDPTTPNVTALGIENGRITALGTVSEVQSALPNAKEIKAGTPVVTPGFIEPHTHPILTAQFSAIVDLSAFTHDNRAQIIQTLEAAADAPAFTPWLMAYGWDPVAISDLTAPTLAELDAISPDRPLVIITQMLHDAYVNTAALEAASVPMTGTPNHTYGIVRDSTGTPTGHLRELAAMDTVLSHAPAAPVAATELLLRRQFATYAKAGYTTIGITGAVGSHPDPVGLLQTVAHDSLTLRSFLYLTSGQRSPTNGPLDGANFKIQGTKFWLDGSPFTGGAATSAPYEDSALAQDRLGLLSHHKSHITMPASEFAAEVLRLQEQGQQIAVHAQGELALDAALDGFEAAQAALGPANPSHRLEHNALVTAEHMRRAKALNLSLGFFVDHLYYYSDPIQTLFGTDRSQRYMPVRSAIDAGLTVTLHGDHPATPINIFRTLQVAVDRTGKDGFVTNSAEGITRNEALAAVTVNAAKQLAAPDIGALKVGYLADLTFLSDNPLTADLASVTVHETWKDGQPVATNTRSWLRIPLIADVLWSKLFG